jgi:HK97 gp10 family phage protein
VASDGEILGLRELQFKLQKLGPAMGGKFLRSAAMSATLPIVKQAEARIPKNDRDFIKRLPHGNKLKARLQRRVAPGFAARNIARKSKLSRDKSFVKVMIGVRPPAYYAVQFVELGTSEMRRQPWLEPAIRQNRSRVLSRFQQILKRKIEKEARK